MRVRIACLVVVCALALGAEEPLVVYHVPDYPPYEYLDDEGRPQGCFIELYRLVGRKVDREVRFVTTTFSESLSALRQGRGGIITGMTDTPERRQYYDFAPGLLREENHLISAIDAPHLQVLADCAGRRIGVVEGEVAAAMVADAGGIPVAYPDYGSLVAAAIAGEVDHFTTSTEVAFHLLIRRGKVGDFRLSDQPILATDFKPAVGRGDHETLALVANGMAQVSDEELERIVQRWLPSHRMRGTMPWGAIAAWSIALLALCGVVVVGATLINRQLRRRVAAATGELASVNRTLQEVLDAATEVAIIATDRAGTITVFNRGAERLLGYAASEVIGELTPLGFHDPAEVEQRTAELAVELGHPVDGFGAFVAGCDRAGGSDRRSWTWVRKDGERRRVDLIVTAMRDEADAIVGYLGVGTDRTRLLEAEEHLARSRKLDALGKLAGGVAHDFNNALAAMMGSAELLAGQLEDRTPQRELAESIVATAERSAGLTRQLLAFARRASVRSEVVELGALIEETLTLARQTVDPRLSFVDRPCAEPLPVMADPGLLQSALLNLLFNARDAMGGSGTVHVTCAREELDREAAHARGLELQAGTYATVEVRDEGPGIPPEILPRIFDPFFTTKAPGEGTGLGLAAVYGIATDHGGAVGVVSRPGAGATLTIALPVAAESRERRPRSRPIRGRQRVLLVDDDKDLRRVTARHLEILGYRVEALGDGAAAVARLVDDPAAADVVVLDLIMPGMHGREVLTALRAGGCRVPVVICSGSLTEDVEQDLLAAGADVALAKPLRVAELTAAIERVA